MTAMNTAVETVAQDVYDLLEDNGFTYNEHNSSVSESEWQKEYPSGNSTVIEVVITKSAIEIYRGEFNKDDIQLGAKDSDVLTHDLTDKARAIITRKSA